jgi:hypothetical protein
MLGIIIGVAAVIAMVSVGRARSSRRKIKLRMGPNVLFVGSGTVARRHEYGLGRHQVNWSMTTWQQFLHECPAVAAAPGTTATVQVVWKR